MLNLQQLWLQKSCSQQLTQPTSESLCDRNRLPITAEGLKIELGQSCRKREEVLNCADPDFLGGPDQYC